MNVSAEGGPPQVDEIAAALERLARLFRRLGEPSAMSLTTAATLSTLERTGPQPLSELATAEGVSQPAMSQLVSRLQQWGMAERRPDPEDGRVVRVHVTDAGRAAVARRKASRAAGLSGLLARLPDADRAALAAALPALDALSRMEPPASPERSSS